jgi:taurine dioxygenase
MPSFTVRDLDAPIGAEVLGFDPGVAPDAEARRVLRQAFDDRGLVVFRDVELEWEVQQFLIDMLVGRSETPEDSVVDEDRKLVAYVSNREPGALIPYGRLLWHSDTMWSDRPEDAIALYGMEVEPGVAPTLYASTTHAWETLPAELRERVEGVSAVHGEGQARRAEEDPTLFHYDHPHNRSVTTPVALVHPRTGRTMLYVSEMQTRELLGMSAEQSDDLLDALRAHLYDPSNRYEHQWNPHDYVVWDNLACQHTRPYVAIDGPVRTLRKVAAPPPWIRPELPPLPEMVVLSTS